MIDLVKEISCGLIFWVLFIGGIMTTEEMDMRYSIEYQVKEQYRVEGHMEAPSDLPPWELEHWKKVVEDIKNEQ